MYKPIPITDLYSLQIEITTFCNSHCIGCARNVEGAEKQPWLPLIHMDDKIWHNIVNIYTKYKYPRMMFNGNFGDAIMHPKLIEFLEKLVDNNVKTEIRISTNGGVRNEQFWKALAEVLGQTSTSSNVEFSVDGIEDTNHIYRRGVDWDRLQDNMSTFINAGGNAIWRMIVFEHNKHQIEEASAKAKKLGFRGFELHYNKRLSVHGKKYKDFIDVVVSGINKNEFTDYCKKYEWKNLNMVDVPTYNSVCPWQQERQYQIGVDGSVHLCCNYGTELSLYDTSKVRNLKDDPIMNYYKTRGYNLYNLNYYSFEEILKSIPFRKLHLKMLENNPSIICKEMCGK